MGAAVDCELIDPAWWGQPVNTATAVAFLIAGFFVLAHGGDRVAALLTGMVGVGSILFHGPMPPGAQFAHDVTIGWVLAWILLNEVGRRAWWPLAFALVAGLTVVPVIAKATLAVLAGAALLALFVERRPYRWQVGLLVGVGSVVGTLSRTGWPWCRPESIWQGHGFWHLAAATALALWAIRTDAQSALRSADLAEP